MANWALTTLHPLFIAAIALSIPLDNFRGKLTSRALMRASGAVAMYFLVVAATKAAMQWEAWVDHPISRHLVPPENPGYFYGYVSHHFFLPLLVTVAAAGAFGLILYVVGRVSKGRMVRSDEVYFAVLCSILVGWPTSFLLGALTFILMIFFSIFQRVRSKKLIKTRLPIGPFLYVSLLTMVLIGPSLVKFLNLKILQV